MYLCSLDVSICAGSHRHHVGHVYSTRVTDRKHKQLLSWGLTRPIQAHLACTPIKIWMQSLMQICSHKHIMSTHKLVHTCTWVSTDFLAFYQSRSFFRIQECPCHLSDTETKLHTLYSSLVILNVSFLKILGCQVSVLNILQHIRRSTQTQEHARNMCIQCSES